MIYLSACVLDAVLTSQQLVVPKDLVKKSQIVVNSFALVGAVLQYCSSPIFEIPRLSWMFVQRIVLMGNCKGVVLLSLLINKPLIGPPQEHVGYVSISLEIQREQQGI